MKQSLGFVECNGLSGAVVAADRMLKTANIKLEGIEQNIGINWVSIKISGDISAVSVAIQTVKQTLPKIYVSSIVLGEPAPGINKLGRTNIGLFVNQPAPKQPSDDGPTPPTKPTGTQSNSPEVDEKPQADTTGSATKEEATGSEATADQSATDSEPITSESSDTASDSSNGGNNDQDDETKVTCNLCGDPKCPRKLGEPHKKCIHYDELKKNKK